MARKHFQIILSTCTFLFLFQTSVQFPSSLEQSDESSSSDELQSVPIFRKIKQLKVLVKPEEKKILYEHFLKHLLTMARLLNDERKIEQDMFLDMKNMIQSEVVPLFSIKILQEIVENGTKALDRILEKRRNNTNPGDLEIMRNQEAIWMKTESQTLDEAKSVLRKINKLLSSLDKHTVGKLSHRLQALEGIKQMIDDRRKKLDADNTFIRKYMEKVGKSRTSTLSTTQSSDSTYPPVLFDEEDIKTIQNSYQNMLSLFQLDLPECKALLSAIERMGMSVPLFCKTHAEAMAILKKAEECRKNDDKMNRKVLIRTLDQPNYKKYFQIIKDCPAPSPDKVFNAKTALNKKHSS